jgi:uracil-DNA glycosylase
VATLAEIEREALSCTRCQLASGRTTVVFGEGDPNADLMIVGEGPGRDEDLQGRPFVGRSGQLLDRLLLEEMGFHRSQVYIGNTIKCLRYNAMVQLGDGSWERIGRLVRARYQGTVMSVDADGRLVPRRVIGWHTSPLAGRRVFRLSYRSAKRTGSSGHVAIQLTGDHEVLTEHGWMPVEGIAPGTRIATGQGLSEVARDAIVGTLLGDATVAYGSQILFGHSTRQDLYAQFKAELISELSPVLTYLNVAAVSGGPVGYPVVHVRARASRAVRTLAGEFYRDGRKRVPSWIGDELTPLSLAIWFMDDGHLRTRPGRRPNAEIATCSFTPTDLAILQRALDRLGLRSKIQRNRLHFDVLTTPQLSRVIAPYVPASMRYKLDPAVADTVPFEPGLLEPGPRQVLWDEIWATEVVPGGTDTTYFCIDVEDTHNFVTSGGVVHNCRPPGNRDPLPEETASCHPWLDAQIELIKPKVLLTLGNFATKLLLGTNAGIRSIRGKVYPDGPGGALIVPTFHPAAALRGGGEVVAQMRADLVRAKRALEDALSRPG